MLSRCRREYLFFLFFSFLLSAFLPGCNSDEDHCVRLPNPVPMKKDLVASHYNTTTETLSLDFTDLLHKFCDDANFTLRVELMPVKQKKQVKNCKELDRVQSASLLSPADPVTLFQYVQGRYLLRLSACSAAAEDNGICEVMSCTQSLQLSPEVDKDEEVCQKGPQNVTSAKVTDATQGLLDFHTCSVAMETAVSLCTAQQSYNMASVFAVEMEEGEEECEIGDFFNAKSIRNSSVTVHPCTAAICGNESVELQGVLTHQLYDLPRNASFCVFYRLENPHCGNGNCFHVNPAKVTCTHLRLSPFSVLSEPMFIGVVSLTLLLSLTLLMWTVIQCSRRRPETPTQQPMKKPPRSLTEDDLEHISRLPSQEIVLVYFPDTQRFKELNRKFRNWLITLDVNDVKDIYDEKCSEDVLKDPERWVRETLGGPEKRIILMCSRLAYECLVTVKKGIASPKFVETDPHFGLLTRAIQYLDREMRGNYRNLICVRYEDLKICDRQYSSEAFNIVPGTEYVLPQHLEDVYRWIHPRDPRPECWAENRQEVRELLDCMRKYRLHDDNMFTVQFPKKQSSGIEMTPVQDLPPQQSSRLLDFPAGARLLDSEPKGVALPSSFAAASSSETRIPNPGSWPRQEEDLCGTKGHRLEAQLQQQQELGVS